MELLKYHSKEQLLKALETASTPCYLYSEKALKDRIARISKELSGPFMASYSLKANPGPWAIQLMGSYGFDLDVASLSELNTVHECGVSSERVTFVGPGKTRKELNQALKANVPVVVESIQELEIIKEAAIPAKVYLRLNISDFLSPAGHLIRESNNQFGMDVEDVENALGILGSTVQFLGFHGFFQSMYFNADTIAKNFKRLLDAIDGIQSRTGARAQDLIFGPGLGVDYNAKKPEVPFYDLIKSLNTVLNGHSTKKDLRRIKLEMGRYIIGPCGVFLTRVLYTKAIRGKKYAICDGGFSANMAACGVGQGLRKGFHIINLSRAESGEPFNVAGPSCYSLDLLGSNLKIGSLEPGDALAIYPSGAYGPTFSPTNFLGLTPPHEVVLS